MTPACADQWAKINIHSRALLDRFNTSKRRQTAIQNAIKERVHQRLRSSKPMLQRQRQARIRAAKQVAGGRQTTLGSTTSGGGGRRKSKTKAGEEVAGVDMSSVQIAARRVRARKLHTVARRCVMRGARTAVVSCLASVVADVGGWVQKHFAGACRGDTVFHERAGFARQSVCRDFSGVLRLIGASRAQPSWCCSRVVGLVDGARTGDC